MTTHLRSITAFISSNGSIAYEAHDRVETPLGKLDGPARVATAADFAAVLTGAEANLAGNLAQKSIQLVAAAQINTALDAEVDRLSSVVAAAEATVESQAQVISEKSVEAQGLRARIAALESQLATHQRTCAAQEQTIADLNATLQASVDTAAG
jgi:uncharacterized coiled-coil protein SlyX